MAIDKNNQLFIPEKLKVGFQPRTDTYTQCLAYVVYFDEKGKLRKETSWEQWRDSNIQPLELANRPTEGFVLNKGVGGVRACRGWDARQEYVRVYDPRNFEFEITVPNLLFILSGCDCSRGKGLEGKFVYAWAGMSLVLLPVGSAEYQNSQKFTALKNRGVKARELVLGATYITKEQENFVYLGRFDYHSIIDRRYGGRYQALAVCKKYIFWDHAGSQFVDLTHLKSIASMTDATIVPDYAELVQSWNETVHGSRIIRLLLKTKGEPVEPPKDPWRGHGWWHQNRDGSFTHYCASYRAEGAGEERKIVVDFVTTSHRVTFSSDCVYSDEEMLCAYPDGRANGPAFRRCNNRGSYIEPVHAALWAEYESGVQHRL